MTNPLATIANLAERTGYTWDASAGRYRDNRTGRFVPESQIVAAGDRYDSEFVALLLLALTERFLGGSLTLEQWQLRMGRELKDANIIVTQAASGGRRHTSDAAYGIASGMLLLQLQKLDGFAESIKAGTKTAPQIRAWVRQTAHAVRTTYFRGVTFAKQLAGYTLEQRFLRPGESCDDCIGYAAQGLVPIGTLPEPGQQSVCRQNCNCVKRYFRE